MRAGLGVSGRLFLLAAVLSAAVALGPAAASADAVKLTFIGDSKAAGIEFSAKAKRLLARGHDVRRDLKVCRRLVATSCTYDGVRPRTALGAIQHYGRSLGRVLVIDVGYNDSSSTYRRELNQVMRAALNRGVKGVVWVNLKTVRADYKKINRIIKRARNRWPRLHVANWNRYSAGHPSWFASKDKIHLTPKGAVKLVRLVRKFIPRAARGPRTLPAAAGVTFDYPAGRGAAPTPALDPESAAQVQGLAVGPPVGTNLVPPSDAASGVGGLLPFAGGAALMLFLVFVTTQTARRRLN